MSTNDADLTVLSDRASLEHELACLRDRHEDAAHLGMVTQTGPPAWICFLKIGMTLPFEPSTLPKRTATYLVPALLLARRTSSAIRFVAPMTLVGRTALSVEMRTKSWNPVRLRSHGDVIGAQDVVLDCLKDMLFHHGNMFVRGSVVHDCGAMVMDHFVQAAAVLDASDLGVEGDMRERLAHLAVDFQERSFRDFKADNRGWNGTWQFGGRVRSQWTPWRQ